MLPHNFIKIYFLYRTYAKYVIIKKYRTENTVEATY